MLLSSLKNHQIPTRIIICSAKDECEKDGAVQFIVYGVDLDGKNQYLAIDDSKKVETLLSCV
jgi:hypothetical protein